MDCCKQFDEALVSGDIKIMAGQYYFVEEIPPFAPVAYLIGSCPYCSKQIRIESQFGYTGV